MDTEELLNHKPPEEEKDEGAPAWMATFADMATLLMTFFILLLSFASMDAQKFRDMLGSVRDAFGVQTTRIAFSSPSAEDIFNKKFEEAMKQAQQDSSETEDSEAQNQQQQQQMMMQQALAIIESVFSDMGYEEIDVLEEEGGVMVRVEGKLLFDSGSAKLRTEGKPVVDVVAKFMDKYNFDLHIMGHTDSVPIETAQFPSNWELSSARATAALRHMLESNVDPTRLVAIGFADSRPIADNSTFEGRERNRRVEFLFKAPEDYPPSR